MARENNAQPQAPVTESVRVDKVGRGARTMKSLRAILAVIIVVVMLIPVAWMVMTAFKSQPDDRPEAGLNPCLAPW